MVDERPVIHSPGRVRVARALEWIDNHAHDKWFVPETKLICLAYDITFGWGPEAGDWDEQANAALRAFHHWWNAP